MKNAKFSLVILTAACAAAILPAALAQQGSPSSGSQQSPAPKSPSATAHKSPSTVAKKPAAPLTLTTPKDKTSYAIGMNIGKSLKRDTVDVDPAILARGVKDALAGGKTLLTDDEVQSTLTALQTELRSKQQVLRSQAAEANKKAGDDFLAANKTQDGVVALPSGLQYKILQQGDGPKPSASDTVVCNYRGTLLDGTEFDSSYKRGQPATFPVTGVIRGWTEALQLMPVGSKWQIVLPPGLAYGDRGAGPQIGPNATLVFEVELLSIQPKPANSINPAPRSAPAPATPPPASTPPPALSTPPLR